MPFGTNGETTGYIGKSSVEPRGAGLRDWIRKTAKTGKKVFDTGRKVYDSQLGQTARKYGAPIAKQKFNQLIA